jgi:hypothetical protein
MRCSTTRTYYISLKVSMELGVQIVVFWVVTPCSLVGEYEHLWRPCCPHLQGLCHHCDLGDGDRMLLQNTSVHLWYYMVSKPRKPLCPLSSILKNIKQQRFGNWISFHPQVKGWETPTLLGPLKRANLNPWTAYVLYTIIRALRNLLGTLASLLRNEVRRKILFPLVNEKLMP